MQTDQNFFPSLPIAQYLPASEDDPTFFDTVPKCCFFARHALFWHRCFENKLNAASPFTVVGNGEFQLYAVRLAQAAFAAGMVARIGETLMDHYDTPFARFGFHYRIGDMRIVTHSGPGERHSTMQLEVWWRLRDQWLNAPLRLLLLADAEYAVGTKESYVDAVIRRWGEDQNGSFIELKDLGDMMTEQMIKPLVTHYLNLGEEVGSAYAEKFSRPVLFKFVRQNYDGFNHSIAVVGGFIPPSPKAVASFTRRKLNYEHYEGAVTGRFGSDTSP